jgi:hypothetical protein
LRFERKPNLLEAASKATITEGTPIFGSVSVADIAYVIKKSIEHNEEAATIPVSGDNIEFLDIGENTDTTKVKAIGTFKVEIKIPNAPETLKRVIEVVPEDSEKVTELKLDSVQPETH